MAVPANYLTFHYLGQEIRDGKFVLRDDRRKRCDLRKLGKVVKFHTFLWILRMAIGAGPVLQGGVDCVLFVM